MLEMYRKTKKEVRFTFIPFKVKCRILIWGSSNMDKFPDNVA